MAMHSTGPQPLAYRPRADQPTTDPEEGPATSWVAEMPSYPAAAAAEEAGGGRASATSLGYRAKTPSVLRRSRVVARIAVAATTMAEAEILSRKEWGTLFGLDIAPGWAVRDTDGQPGASLCGCSGVRAGMIAACSSLSPRTASPQASLGMIADRAQVKRCRLA